MSYLADLERKYLAAIERIKVLEEDNANLRAAVGTMSAGPEVPRALRLTRLEAHLFDFEGDLYGQAVSVALQVFLRAEQKFAGIDALKAQIALDAAAARSVLYVGSAKIP